MNTSILVGIGLMCLGLFTIAFGMFANTPKHPLQKDDHPWSGKQDFAEWCIEKGGTYDTADGGVCKMSNPSEATSN